MENQKKKKLEEQSNISLPLKMPAGEANPTWEYKKVISTMIKHKPLLRCQMVQLKPPALWTKIDVKKNLSRTSLSLFKIK